MSNRLETLKKISTTLSERDKTIWENEAHSACIKQATESLNANIKNMEEAAKALRKENAVLESHLAEAADSVAIQQQTLNTFEESAIVYRMMKVKLLQERDEMRKKYEELLQKYADEYEDHRAIYVNNSKGYKDLLEKQVQLKKIKIANMDLDVKIKNLQSIRKQFNDIQTQMLRVTIVKFAKFYVMYHKNESIRSELHEKKNEEKQLMKQHLELAKLVKEKQEAKRAQERKQRQMENSNNKTPEDNKSSIRDRLRRFLEKEIPPLGSTSMESTVLQQARFTKDNIKVRLLDSKLLKPSFLQNQVVTKPDLQPKNKPDTSIPVRKSALRPCSSTQVTPTGSQQSQNTPIEGTPKETKQSQNKSQEKPLTPKESGPINPILKQTKDEFGVQSNLPQDDNTSKYFTTKKKSVTFQNDNALKTGHEEKSEVESKFAFQNDNVSSKENVKESSTKFAFLNETKSKEVEKAKDGFPFGMNKENAKPGEIQAVDFFQAPFTFTRPEKKSGGHFGFGMFGRKVSGEINTDPTPDTQASANEQNSEESCFDPFETSFRRDKFQSPLSPSQEFGQAPELGSFNFFGSQNQNNLFTKF